jgi:hypothetical protein
MGSPEGEYRQHVVLELCTFRGMKQIHASTSGQSRAESISEVTCNDQGQQCIPSLRRQDNESECIQLGDVCIF